MADVCNLLDTTIETTRSLTFDLTSPILYDLGLEAALDRLADETRERHHIRCRFLDDGQPKALSSEVKGLLYQAVRELVANVVRHANAEWVLISAVREQDRIRVSVADDGIGFEIPAAGFQVSRAGGFGLYHASECLKHLGGRLDVASARGRQPGR